MSFERTLKKLTSKVTGNGALMMIAAIVLGVVLYTYSSGKGLSVDSMASGASAQSSQQAASPQTPYDMAKPGGGPAVQPAQALGHNEVFASAQGGSTNTQGLPPSCTRQPVADPAELLPKDQNNEWASLNPMGAGDLQNVNLLKAGYHIGINSVGQSLRNANLQVRSEPANPQMNVGPWNNTTIEPDLKRTPLEVGQGPQ